MAISWSDKDIWKAKEVVNPSIPISIPATGMVMEFVDQAFKIWILLSSQSVDLKRRKME